MADLRKYMNRVAEDNNEILKRLREVQNTVSGIADDVESNAIAIEELAELISGGEV